MDDLIQRAEAIDEVMQMVERHRHEIFRGELLHYTGVKAMLEALPAVDAVPVVRCKDCKFRDVTGPYPVCELDSADLWEQTRNADVDDWFCAEGERRERE